MMSRWIAPSLLLLCLLFGGSIQQPVSLLVLQCLAIAALAWAYAASPAKMPKRARRIVLMGWIAVALVAAQLVPLPPPIWHALPGRAFVVDGDALLGIDHAWRPISLLPEATLAALVALSVPLAIAALILRRAPDSRLPMASVIVMSAVVGGLWGLAQFIGAAPHPYAITSSEPTGQFANTNHLATLLVAGMPMGAALVTGLERGTKSSAWKVMGGLLALLSALVVVMTGSIAMIATMLLAAPLAVLIVFPRALPALSSKAVLGAVLAAAFILVAAVAAWKWLPADSSISASSRLAIWRHGLQLSPFMIAGGGYGSFSTLYHLVEDPFAVTRFYVNHAHNDFLEVAIDGGLPAIALLAAFLLWWGKAARDAWRGGLQIDPLARAGVVASGVLMIHSLVDFPMRTPAHLALMAAALSMMALGQPPRPVSDDRDLRPTRHRRVR